MDAKNVSAAKPKVGGAVYYAPAGATLPTTVSGALDSAFKELGHISEDGLTNEIGVESEDIKAWGGSVVLSSQTEKTDTFSFTLIETLKADVLAFVHGQGNVKEDADSKLITVNVTPDEADEVVLVVDMILRNGALKRIVVPDAKLSELGEVVYKDDEATGFECTMTAMQYEFADDVTAFHREYIQTV